MGSIAGITFEVGRMTGGRVGFDGAVRTSVGKVLLALTDSNETRLWITLGGRLAGRVIGAEAAGRLRVGRPSRGLAATRRLPPSPRMMVDRSILVQ